MTGKRPPICTVTDLNPPSPCGAERNYRAEGELAMRPVACRTNQSRTPSLPGSSRQDSPNPAGWGNAALTGILEIAMSEMVRVFPTTGGVSIEVDEDQVTIEQEDTMGESASRVWIPRSLFKDVLSCIFARLHPWELEEIAELAEIHGKPSKG